MKSGRRRIEVNLDELDQVLDEARQTPLSEADYDKLKGALHALAAMIVRPRSSEKTMPCGNGRVGNHWRDGVGFGDAAHRTRTQWSRGVYRRAKGRDYASRLAPRRSLPGV